MKIGLLTSSLHGGGGEIAARRWAEALGERGHSVVTLMYASDATGGGSSADKVRFFLGSNSKFLGWLRIIWWARSLIRAERFDVVIGIMTFSNLILLVAGLGLRPRPAVIISEQTVPSVRQRQHSLSPRSAMVLCLARLLYRRADAVIAISHAVATDLRASFDVAAESLWVIPNPVTENGSAKCPACSGGMDMPFTLVIGFVGRLSVEKRPEALLDVASFLRSQGCEARCRFVGDGPLRSSLEQRARHLGVHATFAGWIPDEADLYYGIDCLLLPSDVEGLGNVLLEATFARVPVVAASQALGVADGIVPGVTGILALSPRIEHLALAVLEASMLKSEHLTLENWMERFSPRHVSLMLESVIRCALTGAAEEIGSA
jgi:glycosyltransferase involved in cell wall biosynthesis